MKKAHLSQNEAIDFNGLVQPLLYHEFIKKAARYADTFILSTYVNEHENNITSLADFKKSKWGYLYSSVVDYEVTRKSPLGRGPKQLLIYFRFDQTSITFLNQRHDIYNFEDYEYKGKKRRNWLWNFALVKNGTVVFCSCTREKFCFLDLGAYEAMYLRPED